MKLRLLTVILSIFLSACMEQHAMEQFDTAMNRLCATANNVQSVDQRLSAQPQGCALVKINPTVAAGLNEINFAPGVYRTQATNLGLTAYHDEVLIAHVPDMLVFMTPAAFQSLAKVAATVHEARAEDLQLQAGRGIVVFGSLLSTVPADARPLPPDAATLLQKTL